MKQTISIILNGRPMEVEKNEELTYEKVVKLAFGTPPTSGNIIFTVTYKRGHGNKPEGTLVEGQAVKVKDGMIFNVTRTDKS